MLCRRCEHLVKPYERHELNWFLGEARGASGDELAEAIASWHVTFAWVAKHIRARVDARAARRAHA
jgi:hypothetical protein